MSDGPQDWQPGPQDATAVAPYPPASDHPQAVLAFVLGIMSVAGLMVLGPVAWVVGRNVVRDIDAEPGVYRNRGVALAGMIMGIVGTAFLALAITGITAVIVGFLAWAGGM